MNEPDQVFADGTSVFFATYNEIGSCSRLGCGVSPTSVYPPTPTTAGIAVQSMAIDATNVWVIQQFSNAIATCPKTGCGTLTTVLPGLTAPYDLVVDATHVYWVNGQTFGTNPTPTQLMRANKDGTGTKMLGQGLDYTNLAVQGSTLYFVDGSVSTGGVRSCSIDDCSSPTPIVPDVFPVNLEALYVDSTGLYVMQNGSTYSAPLVGTTDDKIGPGVTASTNVVAVGSTLFWGDRTAAAIDSLPELGGTLATRSTGVAAPQQLAADTTALYFTTQDGKLMKLVP